LRAVLQALKLSRGLGPKIADDSKSYHVLQIELVKPNAVDLVGAE
jgi:hypothetical protein